MMKLLVKIIIPFLLAIVVTNGSNSMVHEKSSRSIQTVINVLLGRVCLCKCGVPDFSLEEYKTIKDFHNLKTGANITASILSHDEEDKIKDFTSIRSEELINETHIINNMEDGLSELDTIEDFTNTNQTFSDSFSSTNTQIKLLGGDILKANGFPWLVVIIIRGVISAGGAIISDSHVVTAASPFIGVSPSEVKISSGLHDRCVVESTSWNVSVSAITLHPSFLLTDHRHDIAILTFSAKLAFNKVASPICLPTSDNMQEQQISWIASWLSPVAPSLLVPRPQPNCVPKVIRLPVLTKDECLRASSPPLQITFEKSCLGPFGAKTQICSGDVGFPVQIINKKGQFELSGILIDSNVCDNTQPGMFIRVDKHISWIRSNIKSGCVCNS